MTPQPSPSTPDAEPPVPGLFASAGLPFLVTGFVGRMPSSMVQLGYLMVLSQSDFGMAVAGLAVAAVGLGSAIAAPALGRLVDRFGPLPVLSGATLLSLLAQLCFLLLLDRHAAAPLLLACAGVVGMANPQVGSVARTHWSHLAARLRSPALVSRALGYEGAVDEIGFVVGPVLAALLVAELGARGAVLAMAASTVMLQGTFLVHLRREHASWRRAPQATDASTSPAGQGIGLRVLWPMLGCLGVGTLFGATQTALTDVMASRGQQGLVGIVYGTVGIGSGVASLLVGRLAHLVSPAVRVLGGAVLVALGAALEFALPGAWLASVASLLLGLGAGMTLVSSFAAMEQLAPRHRIATMMTVLSTCITLGVSGGAAVAGRLSGHGARGFSPLLATVALMVVAGLGLAASRRRVR